MTARAELHLEPKTKLVPLFDLTQPTISHHLKVLRDAGILGSERRGLWAYYYVVPQALDELTAWLGTSHRSTEEPDGDRAVRLPA